VKTKLTPEMREKTVLKAYYRP